MTVIFQDNQTAFTAAIREILWPKENRTLYEGGISYFKVDSADRLVIGYGYDIPSRPVSTVVSDLSAAGLTLSTANISVLTQYKAGTITADVAMNQLAAVAITPNQAETLFNNIKGSYEADVVNRINSVIDQLVVRGILTSEDKTQWKLEHPGKTLSESAESAILFSLQYNSRAGRELIGEGLVTALVKGDRVGAWYEIRYRSNADRSRGVDLRRLDEANAFGLYSTSSGPSSANEAISVIEYLVNKKSTIKEYLDALIITSDERNAKTQELQINIQRSQEYAADFGLYYVQSSQQSLISLAAATGYSTALLSAINGNRTSFNVGEVVRIPTSVSDLSISGTSGLSDGTIGGRNIAYAVVSDTDELGNLVRRLAQYTTTDPTKAGTVTFFDANGKAIESFPTSTGYGSGEISMKMQGDTAVPSISIPTGTTPLDLPVTITQLNDGSVFRSDGRGQAATYYPSPGPGVQGIRSEFTDGLGTLITRNWADNKGVYSENGQKIADVEFGADSRTYIYKDANGNETKRQTFIKNGPVIEELNHGTPAAAVTSYIDMGGYRLENTKSAAGQSYVYKFNDGTRIAGIIGESFLTKIDPQGNESQIDKESFLPLDYVNLGGPPIATVAPLQVPTCDKLVNFGKDIWSKFTNHNALVDAQGACEIVLQEVDGLIGKAKAILGEIGNSVENAWNFSLEYLKSKFDISSSGEEEFYLGESSASMVGEFYSGGERLSALSLDLGKKVYSSFAFGGPEQLVLPYDATAQIDNEQGVITFSIPASGNEPGGTYTIDMETGLGTFSSGQGENVTITESQRFEYLGSGVLRNVDSNGTETTYFPFDPNDSTVVRAVWNYADGSSEQRRWDDTGIGYDASGDVSASILYTSQGKSLTYLDTSGNPTGIKEFVYSDGSREVTNADGSGVTYSSQGIRTSEFSVSQTPVEGTVTTIIKYDSTGSIPTGAKEILFHENGAREVLNPDGTGVIYAPGGGKASEVEIKGGVETRYLVGTDGNRTGATWKCDQNYIVEIEFADRAELTTRWPDGNETVQNFTTGALDVKFKAATGEVLSVTYRDPAGDGSTATTTFSYPGGTVAVIDQSTNVAVITRPDGSQESRTDFDPFDPSVAGAVDWYTPPGTEASASDTPVDVRLSWGLQTSGVNDWHWNEQGQAVDANGNPINFGGGFIRTTLETPGIISLGLLSVVDHAAATPNGIDLGVGSPILYTLSETHTFSETYSYSWTDPDEGSWVDPTAPRSGCFVGETPILMADGSEKPIADIRVGDRVITFDGLGELVPRRVMRTFKYEDREVMEILPMSGTSRQRGITVGGGLKPRMNPEEISQGFAARDVRVTEKEAAA